MDESLYDEFGNYIGPDLEDEDEDLELEQEEEEEEQEIRGFETASPAAQEEPLEPVNEGALMQVDGKCPMSHGNVYPPLLLIRTMYIKIFHRIKLCSMKISNTTHRLKKCMVLVSKQWCKKRIRNHYLNPSLHLSRFANSLLPRKIFQTLDLAKSKL